MGKWKPQDDYLLINTIVNLVNLEDVHKLTPFSADFTINEIQERWYAILYDAPISR
jgi:microspherule protein 1